MEGMKVQELRGQYRHGHPSGTSKLPEYRIWGGIVQRCCNPNNQAYYNYGGRGISVCERWRYSFELFLYDMGFRPSDKHSLERIDNDGDYESENVRWVLKEVQSNNTRSNRMIEAHGRKYSMATWAKLLGINYNTLKARLYRKENPENAIPIHQIEEWPEEPKYKSLRERDGFLLDEAWLKRAEEVNSLQGANLHKIFPREYKSWRHMKGRCLNPNDAAYKDYGGRGIGVHEPWIHSFHQFLTDVGPRPSDKHSLHRLDNDRSYLPGNVAWVLQKEQTRNRRNTLTLTYNGVTKPVKEWSEETGIPYGALQRRIQLDWTPEQILTIPSESGRLTDWGKESSKKAREGYSHSEETRQKMRDAKKNLSDEARRNMSEAHKGLKQSEETIEKRRQALKDKPKSPEHIAKAAIANRAKNPAPIGEIFGRLTVLADVPYDPNIKGRRVLCRCSCGEEAKINLEAMKRGGVKSCGCLKAEISRERLVQARAVRMKKLAA